MVVYVSPFALGFQDTAFPQYFEMVRNIGDFLLGGVGNFADVLRATPKGLDNQQSLRVRQEAQLLRKRPIAINLSSAAISPAAAQIVQVFAARSGQRKPKNKGENLSWKG